MSTIDNETVKRVMDELRQAVNKARDAWDDPAIDAAFTAARAALSTEPTEARETVGCETCGNVRAAITECEVGGTTNYEAFNEIRDLMQAAYPMPNTQPSGGPKDGAK